jgi:hypothetical protein
MGHTRTPAVAALVGRVAPTQAAPVPAVAPSTGAASSHLGEAAPLRAELGTETIKRECMDAHTRACCASLFSKEVPTL